MTHRALRWEVPVDDRLHLIPCGPGKVLGVACRSSTSAPDHHLDVWVQTSEDWAKTDDPERRDRVFTVVGTGQPWPAAAEHLGIALTPPSILQRPDLTIAVTEGIGALVWHLLEVPRA